MELKTTDSKTFDTDKMPDTLAEILEVFETKIKPLLSSRNVPYFMWFRPPHNESVQIMRLEKQDAMIFINDLSKWLFNTTEGKLQLAIIPIDKD